MIGKNEKVGKKSAKVLSSFWSSKREQSLKHGATEDRRFTER
jgi:hypothetical protein